MIHYYYLYTRSICRAELLMLGEEMTHCRPCHVVCIGASLSGGECVIAHLHLGRHSKICSDVLAKIQV